MKSFFQIEIPKRAKTCFKGQEPLMPEMDYFSTLVHDAENVQVQRFDYCLKCWEESVRDETLQQARSHWKSKVQPKREVIVTAQNRDERVLELLQETLERPSEEDGGESFVLALYLARRRLIALRQEVLQKEGTFLLYEVYETEEMLCIKKWDLPSLRIDQIQQCIAKKLKEA